MSDDVEKAPAVLAVDPGTRAKRIVFQGRTHTISVPVEHSDLAVDVLVNLLLDADKKKLKESGVEVR